MRPNAQQIKNLIIQENHKAGCACGFCKNKGNIHHLTKAKRDKAKSETPAEEPEEPTAVQEMRDDIDKLGLPPAAKRYARMTSKDLNTGMKPEMYMDMVGSVTNQKHRQKGFGNEDHSETTDGKKLGKKTESIAQQTVSRMID